MQQQQYPGHVGLLLASLLVAVPLDATTQRLILDPRGDSQQTVFDGVGGLSAGASSRLLYDYPEPQRTQLLDYLFSPGVGAALQVIKVEVGGDTQSTDGTEASHMHTRTDLSCDRGFEWWLLREARLRNPSIVTYGLLWGMPGWVDNQTNRRPEGFDWKHVYGSDMILYLTEWVRCAENFQNTSINWLGIWNESPWGTVSFVKALRTRLRDSGFDQTRLVLMDGGLPPATDAFWDGLRDDAAFRDSFGAVGFHYPCITKGRIGSMRNFTAIAPGHKLWSSEDFFIDPSWEGAACWASLLNTNFISMNLSSTIAWSASWSVYGPGMFQDEGVNLDGSQWGPGLVLASSPWSGHYKITAAALTTAHTTHFTAPGDRYLSVGSGSGWLAGGGSYVTIVAPESIRLGAARRFALILETADRQHCNRSLDVGGPGDGNRRCVNEQRIATAMQRIELVLNGDLAAGRHSVLRVVQTNRTHWMTDLPALHPVLASTTTQTYQLKLAPGSIYTVTPTGGSAGAPPQSMPSLPISPVNTPFPLPFAPDWTSGPTDPTTRRPRPRSLSPGDYAPFFADKAGSWELTRLRGEGERLVLQQRVTARPGANRWAAHNLDFPLTVAGGVHWQNYVVSVRAKLVCNESLTANDPGSTKATPATVYVCGWASSPQQQFALPQLFLFNTVCLQLDQLGRWSIDEHTLAPGVGRIRSLADGNVTRPLDAHAWQSLTLALGHSNKVVARLNETSLAELELESLHLKSTRGMIGLGSAWTRSAFANLTVM